jgi:hypothetical protein
MDDELGPTGDPRCTVCNEPVLDDGSRASVRTPGSARLAGASSVVLYHHRACEREGRQFLGQGTIRVAPANPFAGSTRAGATMTP